MGFVRFGLILLAAVAIYLSIHTLKQHGIEPAARDFWICQGAPFIAGMLVMMARMGGKKKED